jgi:hypothetical protein
VQVYFFATSAFNPSPSSLFQREASYLRQEFPLFERGTESDLIVSFWSFGHWRLENYLRFGLALAGLGFTLTGCWKTFICGVALILRCCGVHPSTPHSSGEFILSLSKGAPCIWTFLSSLRKMTFSANC